MSSIPTNFFFPVNLILCHVSDMSIVYISNIATSKSTFDERIKISYYESRRTECLDLEIGSQNCGFEIIRDQNFNLAKKKKNGSKKGRVGKWENVGVTHRHILVCRPI